ncbi:MAG: urea transporter [Flavobacteriales bacterium]|nr:urea transporter [Flavobacteriales bacterium]
MALLKLLRTLLHGLGQIMLQANAATGLLFLAGITWGAPVLGLAALLAVCSGTATALLLNYDEQQVRQGLYGFSAALVGVALVLFRGAGPMVWAAVVLGSAAAAVIQHRFIAWKIPVFTLPFVLVTWALLALLPATTAVAAPAAPLPVPGGSYMAATVRGFGQVIFQDRLLSGVLFLLGVAAASRAAALFGILGAVLAAGSAQLAGVSAEAVELGLWSFNAVLCAIAFAGTGPRHYVLAFAAVVLSVPIALLMAKLPLPMLTFPFVAASCTVLGVERLVQGRTAEQA